MAFLVFVSCFGSESELRARCGRLEPACFGRCSGLRCLLLLFCCTLVFVLVLNTQQLVFALPCPELFCSCVLFSLGCFLLSSLCCWVRFSNPIGLIYQVLSWVSSVKRAKVESWVHTGSALPPLACRANTQSLPWLLGPQAPIFCPCCLGRTQFWKSDIFCCLL